MVRSQPLLNYAGMALLFLQFISAQVTGPFPPPNCFDPKTVTALTFYGNGAMTTSARAPPIAQLSCVGGNGCSYASQITVVQCQNEGQDEFGNVQWKCDASLPSQVEFGTTTVSCEGCTSSADPFKLDGSCGLMYQLELTGARSYNDDTNNNTCGFECIIGWAFFIALIVYCCFPCCCKHHHHRHNNAGYVELTASPAVPVSYTTQPQPYPYPSAPPLYPQYQPSPVVVVGGGGGGYGGGFSNAGSFVSGMAVQSAIDNSEYHHHHHHNGGGGGGWGGGGGGGGHHHQSSGFGGSMTR